MLYVPKDFYFDKKNIETVSNETSTKLEDSPFFSATAATATRKNLRKSFFQYGNIVAEEGNKKRFSGAFIIYFGCG